MAGELIDEFGSLPATLTASPLRRRSVLYGRATIEALLTEVRAAILYSLSHQLRARPVLSNWEALLDYLKLEMTHHTIERVRVLHLNRNNALIHDEVISEGTIDQANVHVREVVRRAIERGSAAIILAHNHPSGDPAPSRADIDVTRAIVEAAERLGIAVHDHLIIGTTGHVSLRAQGLI